MTEYDYWKIFPRMPKKVTIGDITVRDGFQHLEKFISTRAKIFYAEELIFAGCRNIEVTNLGNPYLMPKRYLLTCGVTVSKSVATKEALTMMASALPQ